MDTKCTRPAQVKPQHAVRELIDIPRSFENLGDAPDTHRWRASWMEDAWGERSSRIYCRQCRTIDCQYDSEQRC